MTENPYEVLGVPVDADDDTIKAAWRQLSRHAHPDRDSGDHEAQQRINVARDILLDPDKRKEFDEREATAVKRFVLGIVHGLLSKGEEVDLIAAAKKELVLRLAGIQSNIAAVNKECARIQAISTQIHASGADNMFVELFAELKASADEQLADLHGAADMTRKALELLRDYRYVASSIGGVSINYWSGPTW